MYLRPCQTCRYSPDCKLKRSILRDTARMTKAMKDGESARGYLVKPTLLGFQCPKKWESWQPGARVEVVIASPGGPDEGPMHACGPDVAVTGTVVRLDSSKDKAKVWINERWWDNLLNEGPAFSPILAFTQKRLIREPGRVVICQECGRPEQERAPKGWSCTICHKQGRADNGSIFSDLN